MIYEKTHPMHEALMQSALINHNYAMLRYSALARRPRRMAEGVI